MATIKSFTDLQQSHKLAEILPLESADMYYILMPDGVYNHFPLTGRKTELAENTDILCWSLAALLNILDYPQLSKDKLGSGKVGWMVSAYPNDCRYDSCWHENPVDACYEVIIKLYELKIL